MTSSSPVAYVYALTEPGTETVRYVGQSVDPERRHRHHIGHARGAVGDWLKSLDSNPGLMILGCFSLSEIVEREQRFIEQFKAKGADLLNRHRAIRSAYGGDSYTIECIETGERFTGYNQAARAYDCCGSSIKKRCDDGNEAYPCGLHFRRLYEVS